MKKKGKRERRKGLTPREKTIIEGRVAGKTLQQIAEEVGTSAPRVHQVVERIGPELRMALITAGYGLNKAVKKMVEMTDAKLSKTADNQTRLSARKTMLEVHGVLGRGLQINTGEGSGPMEVVIRSAVERPARES